MTRTQLMQFLAHTVTNVLFWRNDKSLPTLAYFGVINA